MRQERPYHSDSTASRLLSEVKHCRARLVLRWGTTLESLVLFFCSCCLLFWPLPTIRYIIALYPPSSFLLLGFCSAFRSLRSDTNMKKLAAAALNLYCVSHRPAMLSSVSSRCILMKDVKSSTCCCWSSFGSIFMRSDFPSQLYVVDRRWNLPHVYVYWSTICAAEPSAMLFTKSSICWDYEIGSSSIRIHSESVAAFVPASGAAAGEDWSIPEIFLATSTCCVIPVLDLSAHLN